MMTSLPFAIRKGAHPGYPAPPIRATPETRLLTLRRRIDRFVHARDALRMPVRGA